MLPLPNPQLLVDRLARRRRRLIGVLSMASVVVALLLCVLVSLVLDSSKRAYEEQAQEVAEGMAAVAQINISSELDLADAVVRATAEELLRLRLRPGAMSGTSIDAILNNRLALLPGVEAVRLADASGLVRWGTGLPPGSPMDVSDREYFKLAKKAHPEERTQVAGPLRSAISGNWILVFVRPLWIGQTFAGALYTSISTKHFESVFSRYDLREKDALTLRKNDLRLVARLSPGSSVQGDTGSITISDELQQALTASPGAGAYQSRVRIDGEPRTTAYRSLGDWPFTVYAGVSHARFFKAWERQAWTVALIAMLAWALVCAATMTVYKSSIREAKAIQAMADQTWRMQALLRVAGDGIHIVNQQGLLVEMSDSFAEMLRSTREQMLGRHISSWDANQSKDEIATWLSSSKDGDRQRVDVQHRRDDGTTIDVELQLRVTEIGGEMLVFGSGRDVTAVKKLLREQAAMLESDLVGMARIEGRRLSWRNAAFERIFGYDAGELADRPIRCLYEDEATYRRTGEEMYAILKTGAQFRAQMRMQKKSGEYVWVDFGAVQLNQTEILVMAIDITASKEAHEHLAHAAYHDALTQLPNRMLMIDRLNQALAIARREHQRVAVCFMDLDGFKQVNDNHGHDAGDDLLREVARRLVTNLRPSDTAARIGGDEFVLILGRLATDEWQAVLDRVSQELKQPITLPGGAVVSVGATIGVALSGTNDTDAELLDRADHVMLRGKRSGKGRVFV